MTPEDTLNSPIEGTIGDINAEQLLHPPRFRERVARDVAEKLVSLFGYSLLGLLGGGFILVAIILVATLSGSSNTLVGIDLVERLIVPYLRGIGTFLSTSFGPLLAFILGHYFGERQPK